MKYNIIVGLLISSFLLFSCKTNNEKIEPLFLNSKTFGEKLKYSSDSLTELYGTKSLLSLLNEEEFLNAGSYDFYGVYLFKDPSPDSLHQIYTLKSKDGMHTASLKTYSIFQIAQLANQNRMSEASVYQTIFRVVPKTVIMEFKERLNIATNNVHEDRPPQNFVHKPNRFLFYFDGKEYYRLSDFQVEENIVEMIDSLFRHSEIFKK